jgi:hypothetical protein
MPISRLVILAGLVFFSATAVFMGAAVTLSALARGSITYSFGTGADIVTRTASLASEPGLFWQRLALIGLLPVVLGAAGLWWGKRQFRG